MGLYAGSNIWVDDVYQFEDTDVVQGGPDGIDNKPLKDLADRTVFLKTNIGLANRIVDEVVTTGDTLDESISGKQIIAKSNGSINLSLNNANTFLKGTLIPIVGYCTPGSVINILSPASPIYDSYDDTAVSEMYMHNKEHLILVAMTDHFRVLHASGNFYTAGEEVKGRKEMANTIALKGQLLSRSRYPRLWAYVQSLTFGQEVVSESTWFSLGLTYQGLFTTGDGATTFRIPDERGLFERMLDGGRGIDLSRPHTFPGGYEADEIKSHFHQALEGDTGSHASASSALSGTHKLLTNDTGGGHITIMGSKTGSTGGNETIVKNIGKLNLIKF